MVRPDLPPGARGLVREDGSVVVPPGLAGEVLRVLLRDLSARVRSDGGELSTAVRELMWALHAAQGGVRSPQPPAGSAVGTLVVPGGSVEISANELAEQLGCSPEYARRLARAGRVPARRVGRTWLIATEGTDAA